MLWMIGAALTGLLALQSAAHAAVDPLRFGFLAHPTEQVAAPGLPGSAQLTPEGHLYWGWGELGVDGWDVRTRWRPEQGTPLLRSARSRGGVREQIDAFAIELSGHPVAVYSVLAVNRSRSRRSLSLSASVVHSRARGRVRTSGARASGFRFERPVDSGQPGLQRQLGVIFDRRTRWTRDRTVVSRDGIPVLRTPESGAVSVKRGSRPEDRVVGWSERLNMDPGAALRRTFVVSLDGEAPPPALSYQQARQLLRDQWESQLDGAMRIEIPEHKVTRAYESALIQILQSRYREAGHWVQAVNRLQYQAFWLRDAAVIGDALDLAGLHRAARENLVFLRTWQRPDGLFISRAGQLDGMGQALWALHRHAALTRDPGFAAEALPAIERAMLWLKGAVASEADGLLPAGDPRDNELTAGKLTGDNMWAYAGMRGAVALAALAGDREAERRFAEQTAAFGQRLTSAISDGFARSGYVPPRLDGAGGQQWGNWWVGYPLSPFSPGSRYIRATVDRARNRFFKEGIATYKDGRLLHHYLGFRIWQAQLAAGKRSAVVDGLYAALAHTTASDGGFETSIKAGGNRSTPDNLSPHGWYSAEYIALLRNMLIRESREAERTLDIFGSLSPAWLGGGRTVAISDAPTLFGEVSLRLQTTRRGATLRWTAPPDVRLMWRLPAQASAVRGAKVSNGAVTLTGTEGIVRLTWQLTRSKAERSFVAAADALCRRYARTSSPISDCRAVRP